MEQISISIVLPVGDVVSVLAAAVAECQAAAARHTADYELIIVDDGSTDGTAALADRLAATHGPVAVIHYPRRRGYRQALYDAWGVARGRYIVALNLAGPASAPLIARLIEALPEHPVILGYRQPPPPWPRERLFAAAVAARIAPGLRDPALGLGIFRADLRELLAPEGSDALAHAEIYAGALRRGFSIAQVAVPGKRGRGAIPSLAESLAALKARPTLTAPPEADARTRQGAAVGAGVLIAAGGLWLLRRWRRQP